MADFGAGLVRVRKELGVSQEALAEKAGMQRSHISRIESGRITMPSGPVVDRLAAALGVEPDVLYRASGIHRTTMVREAEPDYDAYDIAATVAKWPKAQRAALWRYIQDMTTLMDVVDPADADDEPEPGAVAR